MDTASASEEVFPTALRLLDDGALLIEWSDGQRRRYTPQELSDHCPAADAVEKRRHAPPPSPLQLITPAETVPLRITAMRPVGRYAYSIHFSFGSNHGIYRFELLRRLGQPAPPTTE